jgi:SAM-dependent methyltransferase
MPVICTACGSDDNRLLHTYTVERTATHYCTKVRDADRNARLEKAIGRLWPDGVGKVYECNTCGFGFSWPHVSGSEEFYSILHEQHGYLADQWGYSETREMFGDTPGNPSALDIGAGQGFFLNSLPPHWSRHAVEGSATTRALLSETGIRVFTGLDDPAILDKRFTLITMYQVLEHIAQFATVLKQMRHLLAPDGHIVIAVPLTSYTAEQERLTGWPDMPPDHVNRWTPPTLERALNEAGLKVDSTHIQPGGWKTFKYMTYLSLRTGALRPGTLASSVYRIKSRNRRAMILPFLALGHALKLVPHRKVWMQGGSFMMIASPA